MRQEGRLPSSGHSTALTNQNLRTTRKISKVLLTAATMFGDTLGKLRRCGKKVCIGIPSTDSQPNLLLPFSCPVARVFAIERERIQTRVNNQIRISPVRVIGPDGTQYGVIPTDEALNRARDAGLDLVEVAPNEKPPVCRIMDFGKYKYEKSKKAGGKTHQTKTKEIRLRPKTGDHDVETKVRQAIGFLKHKDKVQVSVIFRGREMAHVDEGRRVMESVLQELSEYSKIEQPPLQQGKKMIAMVAPK